MGCRPRRSPVACAHAAALWRRRAPPPERRFLGFDAYQKAMEREVAAGRAPPARALTSKERGDVPVQVRALPQAMARFVAAADVYAEKVPPDERSPAIAYKAAELYYAHDDFEEARRRFEQVIVKFPKDPVA